jgi:DNA-binding IclR family transcriptional regulator
MSSPEGRNNSTSLRRALRVLRALREPTAAGRGLSLSDLASVLTMNKSTLLRLIQPLRDYDLVTQDSEGRYRVGVGAVSLGDSYLAGLDLRTVARPVLESLAGQTSETVHLLIYNQAAMVYVDKVDGPSAIRMASRVGDQVPAYCTAAGKAVLAFLPESHLTEVIRAGMPARTPNTITSGRRLTAEVRKIRSAGYAVDDIENELEIRCVAAPVFDHDRKVSAAVSISGPVNRIGPDRVAVLADQVCEAAREVSLRLGAPAD